MDSLRSTFFRVSWVYLAIDRSSVTHHYLSRLDHWLPHIYLWNILDCSMINLVCTTILVWIGAYLEWLNY
jgi:hypothetical protein